VLQYFLRRSAINSLFCNSFLIDYNYVRLRYSKLSIYLRQNRNTFLGNGESTLEEKLRCNGGVFTTTLTGEAENQQQVTPQVDLPSVAHSSLVPKCNGIKIGH